MRRRGQARFFFFLIYGLISLLRYYALRPVLSVSLVAGLVLFSKLACGAVHGSNLSICSKL